MDKPHDRRAYDRRDEETAEQWDGFVLYRELGKDRTMLAAFKAWCELYPDQKPEKTPTAAPPLFKMWAKRNEWQERVEIWDEDQGSWVEDLPPDISQSHEHKAYDRLPYETNRQWLGFTCYRDIGLMGTMRTAAVLYIANRDGIAVEEARKKKASTSTVVNQLTAWAAELQWDERCRVYDDDRDKILQQVDREVFVDDQMAKIAKFRDAQLQAGQLGIATAIQAKQRLLAWARNHKDIKTLAEAKAFADIISKLETVSSELWAGALGVDKLLQELEIVEEDFE